MTAQTDERTPGTDADVPLSAALRAGTRADHEDAERSPFVEHLVDGRLPLAGYADLAAQQWAIYGALEDASAAMRASQSSRLACSAV